MHVRDVMFSSIRTVAADASVPEVAELLADQIGGAVLVVAEDGAVIGVITEVALARALDRLTEASGSARSVADEVGAPMVGADVPA
jgi:predicted transcriptional regulator